MASMLKKTEGVEQSRRRQRFNSHSNSYSSANSQRIRIDINTSEELIDFKNSALVFDMEVSNGPATTNVGLPRYAASSWIKEIRVKDRAGNMIGENIQDYSVLSRAAFEMNVNNESELSVFEVLEGAKGTTIAQAVGTSISTRQYCHQLITHIFGSDDYFPAHLLGGLVVEIDMNTSSDVVLQTSGSTGALYTINNLALVCDLVKLKPEVETTFLNAVQNGGLVVDYRSHHTVKGTVATTTSQRFDLGTLNGRVANLQAVQILTKANQSVDEKDAFALNNLSSYRWKLGSKYLSESQIQCGTTQQAEYLFEWAKSQNINCGNMAQFGNSSRLTPAALIASKFVVGQQVDRANTDMVLSSLKDLDHNRLELELSYSSSPTAATLYVFAQMDKRLIILPGKQHIDNDFQSQGTSML